jgi:hypothetical protein
MTRTETREPTAYLAAIAKDALEQLEAEETVAFTLVYIDFLDEGGEYTTDIPSSTPLSQLKGRQCAVCARGALLLSHLRREHVAELGFIDARLSELDEIIGEDQLDLIEGCFEGFYTSALVAHNYTRRYPGAGERLRAILANIVRNDGVFMPEQDLE